MDDKTLHSYEPFWNNWYIDSVLGKGSFGTVYKIKREEFGAVQYAALKIISVPQSQGEIAQLESAGMSREEIQSYFAGMVQDIYQEIAFMSELKGKSTIVSYEDHEIKERTDQIGYDIFIRMELLESLTHYTKNHNFSLTEVIHMGMDLCQALMVCEKHNILHRDIKPDNIFRSKDGDFKLGDFGIARTVEQYQMGLSVKGSYEYMAPEVYDGKEYDQRVDIYSLGVVLYTFLNKKRIPFLHQEYSNITYQERQQALKRRLAGEEISMPCDAKNALGRVILKAVAYEKEERFYNAEEFYHALEQVKKDCAKEELPEQELDLDRTVVLHATPIEFASYVENKGKRNLQEKEITECVDCEEVANKRTEKDAFEYKQKRHIADTEYNSTEYNKSDKKQLEKKQICGKGLFGAAFAGVAGIFLFVSLTAGKFFMQDQGKEIEKDKTAVEKVSVENTEQKELKLSAKQEQKQNVSFQQKKIKITADEQKNTATPVPTAIPKEELLTLDLSEQGLAKLEDSEKYAEMEDREEMLGTVYLGGNRLKDIFKLKQAVNMVTLDVSENQIRDFSVLEACQQMEMLNITGNPVSDFTWLVKQKDLESLWLGRTKIKDLTVLTGLSRLTDLHLEQTKVEDLAPLQSCSMLTQIDLTGNEKIKDIDALLQLDNLTFVSLDGTRVSDEQVQILYEHMKKTTKEFYLLDTSGREYDGSGSGEEK